MNEADRAFWIEIRRALLTALKAIDKRLEMDANAKEAKPVK